MADETTPIGGVTVEIRAPLDKLSADFAAAQAKTRQADAALQGAMKGSASATTELARAQLQLLDAFKQGASVTPELVRAVGGYEAAQKLLANSSKAAAEAQGVLAAAERSQAQAAAEATSATNAETRATNEATTAQTKHTIATSTAVREVVVLGRELARGNFSRLAGSSTILAQALGLLSPELIAVTAGVVAFGGAAIAAGVATYQYEQSLRALNLAAVGAADASGQTAEALLAEADAASKSGDISAQAARTGAAAFAAAGLSNAQTITTATEALGEYQVLVGEKMPAATKSLAAALGDPAKGAQELNDKFHFLDGTELQNIQTLAQLGDKTAAQNKLTADLKKYLDDANDASGGMLTGVNSLSKGFANFWDVLGKVNGELNIFASFGFLGGVVQQQAEARSKRAQAILDFTSQLNDQSTAAAGVVDSLNPDAARRRALEAGLTKLQQGLITDSAKGNAGAVADEVDAMQKYTRALSTLMPEEEKRHQLSIIATKQAQAKTGAEKAALAAQRQEIEDAGELIDVDTQVQRAHDAAATAGAKGTKAAREHKDAVADETATLRENTAALLDQAAAYARSDAAGALRIEAGRKAADYGIQHPKADVGQMTGLFLGQEAAKAGDTAAKRIEELNEQTAALHRLDLEVASGELGASQVARRLQEEKELRPLVAAAAVSEGKAKADLLDLIQQLTAAQKGENAELARQAALKGVEETVQKALDTSGKADDFVSKQEREVAAETAALKSKAATYGMTNEAAAVYLERQKLLDEATKEGITLTDAQRQRLDELAQSFGVASTQAKQLEDAQKGVAEAAKAVTDDVEAMTDKIVFSGEKGHKLAEDLKALGRKDLEQLFNAEMFGNGPFAGAMGTDRSKTQGGPNGGLISGPLGQLLGMGKGAGTPKGTPSDPLYVASASGGAPGAGGGQGGGLMGLLKGILGGGGGMGGGGAPGGDLSGLSSAFTSGDASAAASGFSSILDAVPFHTGTPYASARPGRPVLASLFTSAPRLHQGLAPDEFPAILQHGEGVTPKGGNARGDRSITFNLKGANGDATIRRIATQSAVAGIQLMREGSAGHDVQHKMLKG